MWLIFAPFTSDPKHFSFKKSQLDDIFDKNIFTQRANFSTGVHSAFLEEVVA
jgi:hypothetical protein